MQHPYTIVDLFAGAGGLSLGFQNAGFVVVQALDSWTPAVETYRRNVGDHVRQESITRQSVLSPSTLIIGGPPCQGFSSAGMRRACDDRNTLVGEFSRLIARERPKAFLFENVEGFLTGASGEFVFELLEPLLEVGYCIHLRKVNAANYGVPQHRKRVIAIGGLGWEPTFPKATHSAYGAPGADLANSDSKPLAPTLIEAIRNLPPASSNGDPQLADHAFTPLTGDDLERALRLQEGQRMRDLPEILWHKSYRRRAFRRVMDGTPSERRGGAPSGVRRLRSDEPSKAITGGALRDFIHPHEHRMLTVRECAVLQTFPIDFKFSGTRSQKMQLIGNAVPPKLAEAFAQSLMQDLAANPRSSEDGTLLSFKPTLSNGMSPLLHEVTRRVRHRYMWKSSREVQRALWD